MADNLPEPKSRTESYLAKAAGEDVTIPEKPESRLEQYLAAIAEGGGGGGGGTTYTAGDGIDITSDVISATNTGKAKTLTSADYNWDSSTQTSDTNNNLVALWLLPAGVYFAGDDVRFAGTSSTILGKTPYSQNERFCGGIVSESYTKNNGQCKTITLFGKNNPNSGHGSAQVVLIVRITDGVTLSQSDFDILTNRSIINYIGSGDNSLPLSAYMGDFINGKIEGRVKVGSGAPTTSTTGSVGQLYEDTTNGKLYQCTDATNPYVWSEVGAGGGSDSWFKTLTEDDLNWPLDSSNPYRVAWWLLEPGYYKVDGTPSSFITLQLSSDQGHINNMYNGSSFIVTKNESFQNWANLYYNNYWLNVYTNDGSLNNNFKSDSSFLTYKNVVDNLTSTSTNNPLSAKQGKELNDKITPTSASGAPTTSTVGILGKIYIDTATDTAYMCTKVDSAIPEYTWKQITS